MKAVEKALETYLNQEKMIQSCDLYQLTLANGNTYYYTDADVNITYDGHVYRHDVLMWKREQIKLNSQVSVDSLTVTIYCSDSDMIASKPVMKAALDGTLDRARLSLKRCFFKDSMTIGAISLFTGKVEIKKAGGLSLQLSIKAETSGLNMDFPIRKYYPQGSFSSTGGKVTAGGVDANAVIAPFIPRKEMLL